MNYAYCLLALNSISPVINCGISTRVPVRTQGNYKIEYKNIFDANYCCLRSTQEGWGLTKFFPCSPDLFQNFPFGLTIINCQNSLSCKIPFSTTYKRYSLRKLLEASRFFSEAFRSLLKVGETLNRFSRTFSTQVVTLLKQLQPFDRHHLSFFI